MLSHKRFFRLSPTDYVGLHRRYAAILGEMPQTESLAFDAGEIGRRLKDLFSGMMRALFLQEGANFKVEIVADPAVQEFVGAHASVLDSSFEKVEMSAAMRRRLSRSNYIFSGMKAFHELHEAFPSMLDESGNKKPFERFLNDVLSIDRTYNVNYLRAEYNFVSASAEMAARWEQFMADGDRYNLQYRTQKDDKVRPEHAALHGVTLPPSDPFWEEFYPPNGWNCRCTVVQVRKSKYPVTPHAEAMRLGDEALQRDKKGMFRFNPGIEGKSVPDYNPYTISKCRTCPIAKGGKNSLAHLAAFIPDSELCKGCALFHHIQECYTDIPVDNGKVRIHSSHGRDESAENISIAKYLANKHGYKIDLLPNPDNETSADSFNHTLGYKQEYKVNYKPTKGAIDNALRGASKQAKHIVIRIDSDIDLSDLTRGIKGRVNQSDIQEVVIIRNGKDLFLSREAILANGFQIQQEDFK